MIASLVRPLRELRLADAPEVGGKAASLGELIASGIRVPDGVVLAAGAVELSADDRRTLLRESAASLGPGAFAVRSSGISEDGAKQSFAGMFESVLDVGVDDLAAAADQVLASGHAARPTAYDRGPIGRDGQMAVIVQRMVTAVAAGVALTADPVTGDRGSTIVTAVRGTGDRLVSGMTAGDEWLVRGGRAQARRRPERAIDARNAERVADVALRIAAVRRVPQDIEWAIDGEGSLWILQARPMTALPPDVSWVSPAPGAFTRQLRFGEWISEPVTPLFESWLLTAMEERLHALLLEWIGQKAPRPYHVVVNGWYFYSLNWGLPGAMLRNLPRMFRQLIRKPRYVAGILPPTVRHSIPLLERQWRDDILPRYRAGVAEADARVDSTQVEELPGLIDALADLAGEYFASVAGFGGAAYKMEINLARFYRRHLSRKLGGSHLPLLTGFDLPAGPSPHAVTTLDWWRPSVPVASNAALAPRERHRLVETRQAAEAAAFDALGSSPRHLRAFKDLLAESQRLVPIREEHVRDLTLAWPVMRGAVWRIGEALLARGVIGQPYDVFFLTRLEVLAALAGEPVPGRFDVAERRRTRDEQARLVAPLAVGDKAWVAERMAGLFASMLGAKRSEQALVSGSPASPGRASGAVRVVRGPDDFDALQPGEILVAPMTAPAWTPLFARAAAVVTDVGSAAAHASIIAREYGIPAVVGCGDATARLRDGMRVMVDGSTGNVEPVEGVQRVSG